MEPTRYYPIQGTEFKPQEDANQYQYQVNTFDKYSPGNQARAKAIAKILAFVGVILLVGGALAAVGLNHASSGNWLNDYGQWMGAMNADIIQYTGVLCLFASVVVLLVSNMKKYNGPANKIGGFVHERAHMTGEGHTDVHVSGNGTSGGGIFGSGSRHQTGTGSEAGSGAAGISGTHANETLV